MTAAGIGFIHTLAGPDHYAPFAAMGAARNWSLPKTCAVTLACGTGHLAGSIVLGAVGIALGLALGGLEVIQTTRAEYAAWALLSFGLLYAVWGVRRAKRATPHRHWHKHDGVTHSHQHTHFQEHTHVHDQQVTTAVPNSKVRQILPWVPWSIFVIFVLGPCEALIPVLMYPAASHNFIGLASVVAVFSVVTLLTMTIMAVITRYGISAMRLKGIEKYGHSLAGMAIASCGASMVFLGL